MDITWGPGRCCRNQLNYTDASRWLWNWSNENREGIGKPSAGCWIKNGDGRCARSAPIACGHNGVGQSTAYERRRQSGSVPLDDGRRRESASIHGEIEIRPAHRDGAWVEEDNTWHGVRTSSITPAATPAPAGGSSGSASA